jgi:hypothetical protein
VVIRAEYGGSTAQPANVQEPAIPLAACRLGGTLWLSHFGGLFHAFLERAWNERPG